MKSKILVYTIVFSLLLSGMITVVGGETIDINENNDTQVAQGIYDWYDLDDVRNDLSGNYVLMNNLNEDTAGYDELVDTDEGWDPIGDDNNPFAGTFDGNDYEIVALYLNRLNTDYLGLFGYVNRDGYLSNINLIDVDLTGNNGVAGLVGINHGGMVKNSYAEGYVDGESKVGGLVGRNYYGTVKDSHASVSLSGVSRVGGLVGWNSIGIVKNSHYNIDDVLINDEHLVTIGGLFDEQYQDWRVDRKLNIEDYDSLVSSNHYYEISDVQGLRDILGFVWNEEYKFRLVKDIDLSSELGFHIPYFTAEFYGNGNTIYNLYIDQPFSSQIGMFGYLPEGAFVSDLSVVNVEVRGYSCVGGLVGRSHSVVKNSYATGNVSGEHEVGGLIGFNYGSTGEVENSYSTVNVSGNRRVGGLVGLNSGFLNSSYSTGNVSGNGVGGLVGSNSGTVSDSFWDIEASGIKESDGGTGKTTAEMKDVATYTDTSKEGLEEPWDFVGNPYDDQGDEDIWDIDEEINDGYPFLTWDVYFLTINEPVGEGTIVVDGSEITEWPFEETYKKGTEVELNTVPEEGWHFVEWTGDHESEEKEITIAMNGDKTVTANFGINEYYLEIKLEGEGTTSPEEGIHRYEHGDIVILQAIPTEGWKFVEWTGDYEGTEEEITITMKEDMEITAHFEEEYEAEDYEAEDERIPGFTSTYLLLAFALAILVAIYNKKGE